MKLIAAVAIPLSKKAVTYSCEPDDIVYYITKKCIA